MLEAANLECVRGDRRLFRNLSFIVRPGEVCVVTGRNGSGKTSLLRILCGLTDPIVGEIRGRGLMVSIDLVRPDGSRRALDERLIDGLNTAAWKRGLIVFAAGRALRLAPPLCIDASQIDELASIATEVVRELADTVQAGH